MVRAVEHSGQSRRQGGPSLGPGQLVADHRLPLGVGLDLEGRAERGRGAGEVAALPQDAAEAGIREGELGARRIASR